MPLTDPCAKSLLDWISVGESGGNYDAVMGDRVFVPGTITGLTIAAAYDFQRRMVAVDGKPSGAIGKYQIIQRTLSGLVQRLGLSLDTLLTADVQDQLGLALLQGRLYDKWQYDAVTDDEFMHALSCEWASLPDPMNEGKSHYDHDSAGNHASRSLEEFGAALVIARNAAGAANA